MEFKILILLHVLGATIWTGGHIVLSLGILPRALRENNFDLISNYERSFEFFGMPALVVQFLTGFRIGMLLLPVSQWFAFDSYISWHIVIKLSLLVITILLAIYAKLFAIRQRNLKRMKIIIPTVTIIAVLFVAVGVSLRTGSFFN